MTTVPCPRCAKPVGLEEEVCPHCRTPRDEIELDQGRELVRREAQRLKRRPRRIAVGVAALVVLCLAWSQRGYITAPLAVVWADFAAEVERTRDPRSHFTPRRLGDHSAEVAASSFVFASGGAPSPFNSLTAFLRPPEPSSAGEDERPAASTAETASPPPPSAAPAAAEAAPVPVASNPDYRAWYGVVYDLATLEPITNAMLRFKVNDVVMAAATTDAAGHYRVDLERRTPSNTQVSVSISNPPGYREGLLEDLDPPLRKRSHDARRLIMDETTDNDLEPVPLRCKDSAQVVELDLVLVPLAKK